MISRSEAWDWVCKANEINGLMRKLPDPKVSWKTDAPQRMQLAWLHDHRKPEWGHVWLYVALDNHTNYQSVILALEAEIERYSFNRVEVVF